MGRAIDRQLLARYADCWARRIYQPIDEWLRENVRLDTTSPLQGPYDISHSPQLRDPLLAWQDDDVRMVTTIGPNQGGRTQAMLGACMWSIIHRPGPMQWNTVKDEAAKEFAEQKWWPTAMNCPAVVAKLPSRGTGLGRERHKERIRNVIFADGMPFKVQGCSRANLEEKSIMTQFNDECYQWPVGRLEVAHIRCNVAYAWNYKIWNGSVAGVSGDDIDLLFRSGTSKEWHFRCPKCGELTLPEWKCIKWETSERTRPGDREWDYAEVRKTVRYECPSCGHTMPDSTASRRALNEGGCYVQMNRDATPSHQSFRFNVLSVNWPGVSWGQWVEEFLRAVYHEKRYGNHEPLRRFWTRRMAEPWDESRHLTTTQKIVLSDYRLSDRDYRSEKWERESIRFMGVDKQEWGYPYVIRAVAQNGDSRLIAAGVTERTCLSSYDEVEAKAKEYMVSPRCVLIDCGYETREVYAHAARRGWTCMRGVDRPEPFRHYTETLDPVTKTLRRVAIELPYSEVRWADPFTGTALQQTNRARPMRSVPHLARRFDWINLHIKNLLHACKEGRGVYWGVPADVGPEYIQQINAEVRHSVIDARGRRVEWWSNTSAKGTGQRRPNHAWDCECMILVAMCLQKLFNLADWQDSRKDVDVEARL